ncbi:hypothetical protein C3E98_042095, partial [Pseudomonas sp. MWU13-2625]
ENRKQVYVPCRNTATTPSEHFRLAPEDFAAAEDRGAVLAVVHSHPDYPATASEADRVSCEASGLPWYILEVRKGDAGQVVAGELATVTPEGYHAPLIGRPFHHGVLDCITLVDRQSVGEGKSVELGGGRLLHKTNGGRTEGRWGRGRGGGDVGEW